MKPRGILRLAAALLLVAIGAAQAQDAPPAAAPTTKELVAKLAGAEAAAAADALVSRGAESVPDLVAALDDPALKLPALGVIERMGPTAKDAVPRIALLLKGVTSPARAAAARTVGVMGADGAPALPGLASIVAQTKAKDRREAVESIRWILLDVARQAPRPKALSDAEKAIQRGCDWLVRHQGADGRWGATSFQERCQGTKCAPKAWPGHDLGVTGLAALAVLNPGRVQDGRTKAAAAAAVKHILAAQDPSGFIGDRTENKASYIHAIAGRALAEAWMRTRRPELRVPVERLVAFTLSIQSAKGGGWRYDVVPGSKDNDTSITAWMAGLLHAAAQGGIAVDPKGFDGGRSWVLSMTEPEYGKTGYQQTGGMSARTVEMQDKFPAKLSESLTACGLVVRLVDERRDALVEKSAALLLAHAPVWSDGAGTNDFYYWVHGSDAMRRLGGKAYVAWRRPLLAALLPSQRAEDAGCGAGSWPAVDPWCGEGGQVYATAMAVLALEHCVDDPATRPALTPAQQQAVAALEAARPTAGEELSLAIDGAVQSIRAVFR